MSCGTKGGDILFSSCILCCMVQNRSMIPYFAVCKAMVAKFVGDMSLSSCIYVLHRMFRWNHMFQLYARRFNIETFRWYHMITICSSYTLCHVVQKRVSDTIICSSCTLCHVVQKRVGDTIICSSCTLCHVVQKRVGDTIICSSCTLCHVVQKRVGDTIICSSCTLCHVVQKRVGDTICSSRTLCHMVRKSVGGKNKISYCYITFYVTCLCCLVT